jgi:hypothetical protein
MKLKMHSTQELKLGRKGHQLRSKLSPRYIYRHPLTNSSHRMIPIPPTDTPRPPTDTPRPPTDTPRPPTDTPRKRTEIHPIPSTEHHTFTCWTVECNCENLLVNCKVFECNCLFVSLHRGEWRERLRREGDCLCNITSTPWSCECICRHDLYLQAVSVTAFLTSYIGAEQGSSLRSQAKKRSVTAHQLRGAGRGNGSTEKAPHAHS